MNITIQEARLIRLIREIDKVNPYGADGMSSAEYLSMLIGMMEGILSKAADRHKNALETATNDDFTMKPFKVIKGGQPFHDPDEIPAPDKPIEEWTDEDHEAYNLTLWQIAEPSSIEYAVKTLDISPARLEFALSVLEAVQQSCARESAALGLRDIFRDEKISNLIWCIRQRLKELNKSPEE